MSAGIIMGNTRAINIINVTLDVPEIAANTSEENDVTVTGLLPNDVVLVIPNTFTAGVNYEPTVVSADDTLPVRTINSTGSGVNPASGTFTLMVTRPEGNVAQDQIAD